MVNVPEAVHLQKKTKKQKHQGCTLEGRTSHKLTKFSKLVVTPAFHTRRQFISRLTGTRSLAKQQPTPQSTSPRPSDWNQTPKKDFQDSQGRPVDSVQSALHMELQQDGSQVGGEGSLSCFPLWIVFTWGKSFLQDTGSADLCRIVQPNGRFGL